MTSLFLKIKSKVGDTNDRIVLYNTLGAFVIKGSGLLISIFMMPAYLNYFGDQRILGLWFTILSVLSWILTFDLGIGNGLRNSLVSVFNNQDNIRAKKYISSAYIVTGVITVGTIVVSTSIFNFLDWNKLFNISNSIISNDILNKTVIIVFSGIMIQFVLKLITSILYALQQSALTNFLSLLSSVINLIYISLANFSDVSTSLIYMAVIQVLSVNLPLLITSIVIFSKKLKKCRPSILYYEKSHANEVMKVGGMFFIVQIMYMILTTTNEFLITWLTGPQDVVNYQIYNKLFSLIGTLFVLALAPIWSAVTKALVEGNYIWIKKIYKRLKIIAILAIVLEISIIPFLQIIIDLWIGKGIITVNYEYAFIFAISGGVLIWNSVLSSIANGLGQLKTQGILFSIGAIIKVPLAIFFVSITGSWIGIIIAYIISMGLYCIIQPLWLNKFLNKK